MSSDPNDLVTTLARHWPAPVARALADALGGARPGDYLALDFDNSTIAGDLGESLHYRLCRHRAYALDGPFWRAIADAEGRDRLRAACRDEGEDADRDGRDGLTEDLIATYPRRLARLGVGEAYRWAVTLHAGMRPSEVASHARAAWEAGLSTPMATHESVAPDGTTLRMGAGLRLRPATLALIAAAHEIDIDVWFVTATNEWAVQEVAPDLGVPPERVIGNRCRVRDGYITSERVGPPTWRAGKVAHLRARLGRAPLIAIGDSQTDIELLDWARGCSVCIDRGDRVLAAAAETHGWHRVPATSLAETDDR